MLSLGGFYFTLYSFQSSPILMINIYYFMLIKFTMAVAHPDFLSSPGRDSPYHPPLPHPYLGLICLFSPFLFPLFVHLTCFHSPIPVLRGQPCYFEDNCTIHSSLTPLDPTLLINAKCAVPTRYQHFYHFSFCPWSKPGMIVISAGCYFHHLQERKP